MLRDSITITTYLLSKGKISLLMIHSLRNERITQLHTLLSEESTTDSLRTRTPATHKKNGYSADERAQKPLLSICHAI